MTPAQPTHIWLRLKKLEKEGAYPKHLRCQMVGHTMSRRGLCKYCKKRR